MRVRSQGALGVQQPVCPLRSQTCGVDRWTRNAIHSHVLRGSLGPRYCSGSGCNYDFEHVWSSTSCPACSSTSSAFYTQWGFSQVAVKDGGARTPAECVESTELAFTRCCADTCSGTDPQGDYDALVAIRNGVTKTGAGGCPSLTDELGTWPEALPGASSAIKCPGSATDSIFRLCSAAGRWQDVQTVDTSACQAPTACDVCDCYDCGSNGRGCGAAVGLQTSSRGLEHFVDCAHKSLVVLPVNFPSNTSRIDLQGNTMVQRYSPNTFLGATRVWRICALPRPRIPVSSHPRIY